MAKLNHQILSTLCEAFAITPTWTKACRTAGISRETLNQWMARSRKGDQALVFEWEGDGVVAALHVHMEAARQLNILALEANVRDMASEGWSTPKYFQGTPVWLLDPYIVANPDMVEFLDLKDAPYMHDESGARVQAMDTVKPSPELQVKRLEQLKSYRKQIDVNVTGGGLKIIERPDERKAVEHHAAEQVPFVGDNDTEKQQEATNILAVGRPAASSEEFDEWAKSGEFEQKPVTFRKADGSTVEREPVHFTPPPGSSKRPTGPVNLGDGARRNNDPPENTGSGGRADGPAPGTHTSYTDQAKPPDIITQMMGPGWEKGPNGYPRQTKRAAPDFTHGRTGFGPNPELPQGSDEKYRGFRALKA